MNRKLVGMILFFMYILFISPSRFIEFCSSKLKCSCSTAQIKNNGGAKPYVSISNHNYAKILLFGNTVISFIISLCAPSSITSIYGENIIFSPSILLNSRTRKFILIFQNGSGPCWILRAFKIKINS